MGWLDCLFGRKKAHQKPVEPTGLLLADPTAACLSLTPSVDTEQEGDATTGDEKRESSQGTILTIREEQSSYQDSEKKLELYISVLKAHKRATQIKSRIPGATLGLAAGWVVYDILRNYSARTVNISDLERLDHIFATTWANYSYIRDTYYSDPKPWYRIFDFTTCNNVTYHLNWTSVLDGGSGWFYSAYKYNFDSHEYCGWLSYFDFRSSTGLALCAQIMNEICEVVLRDDPSTWNALLICIAAIGFISTAVCCLRPLSGFCGMPWNNPLVDSTSIDLMYGISRQFGISNLDRERFELSFTYRPNELLRDAETCTKAKKAIHTATRLSVSLVNIIEGYVGFWGPGPAKKSVESAVLALPQLQ